MSVHRLQLERELREAEAELLLVREGELRAAETERLALVELPPGPRRKRVPHRTKHLLVAVRDPRSVCAKYLLAWWKKRSAFGAAKRPVSTNEINRLAAILRRLET
jgi:hypothetical protein